MRCAVLSLLLIGAAIGPAEATERASAFQRFRDWMIGCDNRGDCRAMSRSATDAGGGVLIIDRAADGAAAPALSIAFHSMSGPGAELVDGTAVELSADGTRLGTVSIGAGLVAADEDRSVFELRDSTLRQAVLDATRRAQRLTVTPAGVGDPLAIPLEGASAALLFMDDRQGRIGTVTALTRRGNRPAAAIPASPALPSQPELRAHPAWRPVPDAVPQNVLDEIRPNADECFSVENEPTDAAALGRVDADLVLLQVLCLRGAYNYSYRFHLWNDATGRVSPLLFPVPNGVTGAPRIDLLTNPEFEAPTMTLSHFSKGRGLGDCGSTGQWRWDGRTFALTSYEYMPHCQGLMPGNWLTLHRSQ